MKSQGEQGEKIQKQTDPSANNFSLQSISFVPGNKFNIEVEFAPEEEFSGVNEIKTTRKINTIPKFNDDGNYLSPAFSLKPEKFIFEFEDEMGEESHVPKSEKQKEDSEEIMIAKPNSLYCKVCEISFIDYLNHIKREEHIYKIKRSYKKLKMNELIIYFGQKKAKEKRKNEKKNIILKKKSKDIICEDPSSYTPVSVSKSTNENTNNSSLASNRLVFQKLLHS